MGAAISWRIPAVAVAHQATAPCMSSFHKLTTIPAIVQPLLTFWLTSRKLNLNARRCLLLVVAAGVVGATACAGVKSNVTAGTGGSTGTGGHAGGIVIGDAGTPPIPPCTGPCTDFSKGPYLDTGVSHDVAGMFGTPTGAGPCVTEPENGALFPNNWLRPRVRVPGSTGSLKIT